MVIKLQYSVVRTIYNEIFCNLVDNSTFVFLCGGAGHNSIRDKVRDGLLKRNYQVLYPEDLFIDIINKNKEISLFEMEEFLANNADIICIICESVGSAVELGAFTQNELTRKKLIIAIEKKYYRNKSFIMLGPVRMRKRENERAILSFKKDEISQFIGDVEKSIKHIEKMRDRADAYSFNNLSDYILFIPLVIFFYKSVLKDDLERSLKNLVRGKKFSENYFDNHFSSAIKYLLKVRNIQEIRKVDEMKNYQTHYIVTDKGRLNVCNMLDNLKRNDKNFLFDGIRLGIMKSQLYN